jgi:glutamyl-tRNA synthetase
MPADGASAGPRVRFAPSPTGFLHVGNARAALVNWLFARRHGGHFLLRIDDTDTDRSTDEFARAIEADLRWLGLDWDAFARQSDRLDRYALALDRLRAAGRLYPCYETAEELEAKRRRQLARRLPPVYDRAALALTDDDRARLEAEGRRPHWRFRLDGRRVEWRDLVKGPKQVDTASLSDPVLVRADGRVLYTLSSVVDDIELGITHVIRGEDHVTNSGVQVELFEALGGQVPDFGHLSLLVGAGGEELSKRVGALSLGEMRADGIEPMALASLLARLGSADPVEAHARLDELVAGFDLGRFGQAPAHFDPAELRKLNAKVLHATPFDAVASRLAALGVPADEAFWEAVRPNLARLEEAADWWAIAHGHLPPAEPDPVARAAADLLPPPPWGPDTWPLWTKQVSESTGAKGKALFLPLRRALTGRDHGPEMKAFLPLIDPARARARLLGEGG